MFTVKFYTTKGRSLILSAESFTILRDEGGDAEITLHQADPSQDRRIDVVPAEQIRAEGWPPAFQWAYIVNRDGKTIETIRVRDNPR